MPYKSLQQLRDEQQAHHDRAMRLLREAAEIHKKIKSVASVAEFLRLQKLWLEKNSQAAVEIERSIELSRQYIQELERLKNRDLN